MGKQQISCLRRALAARNPQLLDEVDSLVKRVTPLLWRTLATFPTGTSHTPEHTSAVEQNVGMLLSNARLQEFTDDEIAFIILGCHFHDLGMAGTEQENSDEISREQARRDHSVRIGDRIRDSWQEIGFSDQSHALALAEVCRGHRPRKVDDCANWSDLRENAILGPGRTVRLRLVSALVFAADELHIGEDRAPFFDQKWLKLQNDESRRHWKRHQCVHGPTLNRDKLCFDVHVSTYVLEGDLRKNFLCKAFAATRDAQAQLNRDGITRLFPKLKITWVRDDAWRLGVLKVLSDMSPKTREQIADAIYADFIRERAGFFVLSGFCDEQPETEEDIRASIFRTTDDYISRSFLTPSAESSELLVLDTSILNNQEFSRLARAADEIDVLFAGRYASHHEFDLLRSAYGEAFAHKSLTPLIANNFGVDLATEPEESAVRTVLGLSPTAARIVIEFPPAPSILVKRHLLRLCALSGSSLDLLRCPDLILRSDFRAAFRALSKTVSANQEKFLDFVEELVLVDGYSFEQIWEALSHSDAALAEMKESVCPGSAPPPDNLTELRITQSIPLNLRPSAVSLAHLYVVSQRTQSQIELLNTDEAPLTVTPISATNTVSDDTPIVKMSFGPGRPTIPNRVDRRTSLNIDVEGRTMDLSVQRFDERIDMTLPIIAHFAMGEIVNQRPTTTVSFSFYLPALTANHLHGLLQIENMVANGNIEMRMIGGPGVATTQIDKELAIRWKLDGVDSTVVTHLLDFGPDTPYPWHCPEDDFDKLANQNKEIRRNVYEKSLNRKSSPEADVTTITLRYANENGFEYREEFLGYFPSKTFKPPRPTVMSKEEFERWWEEGREEGMLAMSFASDMHDLAREIRDWADDPSQPFPLKISPEPPTSPIFKTRFELVYCAKVDRLWYFERPVIMRVRPINDIEKWNVEGSYWESIGDQERADILRERIVAETFPKQLPGSESPGLPAPPK